MQCITICFGLIFSALMMSAPCVCAAPIPIVNPGFETVSRPLVGGEQTNGIGGDDILVATRSPFPFGVGIVDWSDPVTVPGWRTYTVPFGSPGQILAGVLRPAPIDGTPFVTGAEGGHVLAIQAALVGQETSAVLQPDTTYTLSFLGAVSQFDSDYFISVSLTAIEDGVEVPVEGAPGVTRLASGSFFPPGNMPDGVLRRYEVSYTSPEALPAELVGTRVGINIFGSDGIPRVIYDDFALETDGAVPGDLNGDGEVNANDLAILLAAWGANAGSPADFNGDGVVDSSDLAVLLAAWGG